MTRNKLVGKIIFLVGIILTFQVLRAGEVAVSIKPLPESSSDLEQAVGQLSKNYELLRRQTTQGFILAVTFMILGFLVILSGSIGEFFGLVENGSKLASVAGIILEFISGTALVTYRINFNRLNQTSDNLHQTWKILTAFRKVETLPEVQKTDLTTNLINALLD